MQEIYRETDRTRSYNWARWAESFNNKDTSNKNEVYNKRIEAKQTMFVNNDTLLQPHV